MILEVAIQYQSHARTQVITFFPSLKKQFPITRGFYDITAQIVPKALVKKILEWKFQQLVRSAELPENSSMADNTSPHCHCYISISNWIQCLQIRDPGDISNLHQYLYEGLLVSHDDMLSVSIKSYLQIDICTRKYI